MIGSCFRSFLFKIRLLSKCPRVLIHSLAHRLLRRDNVGQVAALLLEWQVDP